MGDSPPPLLSVRVLFFDGGPKLSLFTVRCLISLTFLLDCIGSFLYGLVNRCSPEPMNVRSKPPDWKSKVGDKTQQRQRLQRVCSFQGFTKATSAIGHREIGVFAMDKKMYAGYLRVSTAQQGKSGLGLESQRTAISAHINGHSMKEFLEVESGRRNDRPELIRALAYCRRTGATLIIAKMDRLSRNARFILELLDSDVELIFCDMPQVSGPTGRFLLTSMAAVAQLEREMCSVRTREALAAAKRRGVVLGARKGKSPLSAYLQAHGNKAGVAGCKAKAACRAEAWREVMETMVSEGLSRCAIARTLNAQGEKSVRGGAWTPTAVKVVLARLEIEIL